MKLSLPTAIVSRVSRQALIAQKHSPRVLFVGGIALMGATVVTACQGTLKLEGVLDDVRRDRDDVKAVAAAHPEKYDPREIAKLNTYITLKGIAKISKLYLPAITLGVAAVACLTSSHNILARRNAGLSAALAATDRALKAYRERVVEEFGEDKDRELMYGTETYEVTETDAKGKEKVVEKVRHAHGRSPYAVLWGRDTTTEFSPFPEYNLAKLRHVQQYGTMLLNTRGHVFLNEMLDELGLDRTQAGAVVGWLSKKHGGADGYIDFGVIEDGPDALRFIDFMTGHEDHILLDFNVDGEIWRKI